MREITVDEAIATIIDYPDKDYFISWNVVYSIYNGEPTDNSIELAQYWDKCKTILTPQK